MINNVYIEAAGARTPLGLTAESSAAAVRAGIDMIMEHPFMINSQGEPMYVAMDSVLDPTLFGPRRLVELAASALQELCETILDSNGNVSPVPLLIALPEQSRPGWDASCTATCVNELQKKSFPIDVTGKIEVFPFGHAAGIVAMQRAVELINKGLHDVCIVGGVDSFLQPDTMEWFDRNRLIVGDDRRSAFVPGEGAGFCAVVGNSYGPKPLPARVRSIGIANEPNLINTESICLGKGLTAAIDRSLKAFDLPGEAIDVVYCDINGERYRSEEWAFSVLRHPLSFKDPAGYELTTSLWGDTGAASAPLFTVLAMEAGKKGYAKGKRNMIWTSSITGERGAMVLELGSKAIEGLEQ